MNKPDDVSAEAKVAAMDAYIQYVETHETDITKGPTEAELLMVVAMAVDAATAKEREKNALSSDQLADAFDGLARANKRHRVLFQKLSENFRFHAETIRKGDRP